MLLWVHINTMYTTVDTYTDKPLWIRHRTGMPANGQLGGCSILWQRGQGFRRSLPRSFWGPGDSGQGVEGLQLILQYTNSVIHTFKPQATGNQQHRPTYVQGILHTCMCTYRAHRSTYTNVSTSIYGPVTYCITGTYPIMSRDSGPCDLFPEGAPQHRKQSCNLAVHNTHNYPHTHT